MKLSVFTASTPDWEPEQAAGILAAQGWDGVEWRIVDQADATPPGFWAGNRSTWPLTGLEDRLDDIARITRDAGLEFSGLGGYANCRDHDNVERMLAATSRLGARQVRVTMPGVPSGDYRETFATTRSDLEWIEGRAAEHGVRALVELHHGTITSSASAAIRLVDGLDPERVGVIHDLGNLLIEGHEDFLAAFQMLGPYLAHVHVKNALWRATDEPGFDGSVIWRNEWAPLRSGQANVEAYFEALHEHGYDGWVTVEDFSTELPLEQRTADNLAYLRAIHERVTTRHDR
ncbi:sugar phosphate isomerase/epimerase family protein [Lacisediminihabitans profunda]|uniref:Sugar phosphate isomerase/epimerase n=1 Tax=Lacisediminihabitans profunda TaxID=2594790 RepID=A0A5C8US73_9MICO|nr:sugar phosphate isomerase/epimerase family protein [Lacisediminihabitans profunda]TXN31087.1 sugar phosphate isomerase/epimerase [Lacisediminihabitans profunda]